jgi:hypothetical protein
VSEPEDGEMKRLSVLGVATGAMFLAAAAQAHEVPGIKHTHAFEQTGYGTYRQGHMVDGPQGSIIIWSPQNVTGYQSSPPVKFARPQPITRAPGSPAAKSRTEEDPALEYGKKAKKDYGG